MAKKKIDFSGVETFERAPEGTHAAKIATVEEVTFQSGNEGFKVAFEITKGAGKGAKVYENYPLMETTLWKLKNLLEAVRIKCDGRIVLDTDKLIGKVCEIEVSHEEYDGKTRARLAAVRKLGSSKTNDDEDIDEDIDEEEDEVEETKPVKKEAKKSAKKQPEPEEDDDVEEDDDEDEKPVKKTKKDVKKPAPKAKKQPEPEEDDDDDWDDDWDDED